MSRLLSYVRHTINARLRPHTGDRGAGFVEYAGLLLLIATVVVAVVSLNIHVEVGNAVSDAVGDILE
ncbi:hypothetical protein FH609_016515 [Streptomyces sp. 3MP-14]|uniref:Flp family type IVb pilin n=1 Tax=Streptomyces mimosae TaxID=2586635 RepID=A0A5N6AAA2_9ACTN|nr:MULTISPECIES: hypothetical protein [Streptomyces]KAB8165192.1 hypothetical protein FH607_013840 [Streptomyces mimosae]KAB8175824.1 hypothetical protein FH609_016515 [Streptomyces sp. 3MP-14]